MRAWESGGNFREAVECDQEILKFLPLSQIKAAFSLERYLKHVDRIFARVFHQ
jgi:adenylosuccinate lyase